MNLENETNMVVFNKYICPDFSKKKLDLIYENIKRKLINILSPLLDNKTVLIQQALVGQKDLFDGNYITVMGKIASLNTANIVIYGYDISVSVKENGKEGYYLCPLHNLFIINTDIFRKSDPLYMTPEEIKFLNSPC